MASELRVDKIIPTTGVPTNGAGGVIQTVYYQAKSAATASTTTNSWQQTTTTATITPKFATSHILIHCNFFFWFNTAASSNYCVSTIYRNSTNLGTNDLGDNKVASHGSGTGSQNAIQWYQSGNPMATYNNGASFSFFDKAHNSTSALTYTLYLKQHNNSGDTFYFGWTQQVNLMMLQEISA